MDNINSYHSPTSEVGYESDAQLTMSQEQWRAVLDIQNKNMRELINAMRPVHKSVNITLPKFNPEKFDVDPLSWCSAVDMCMEENLLEGSSLIIALSKALEGSASQWLSQISFSGITWLQFKDLFIARYEGFETPAATLTSIQNSKPREGECLSAYGTRLVTSLMNRWKLINMEEIVVAIILSHLSQFDSRLQHTSFTTKIATMAELQRELKAYSYGKRKMTDSSGSNDVKRPKFSNIRCHYCGKVGHKIAECRDRRDGKRGPTPSTSRPTTTFQRKGPVTCFKCGEIGHISSGCTNKTGSAKVPEKRIDMCEISVPTGILTHSGELYYFCFDSGAECSLINEKIASKFSGKRIDNVIKLKGIGNATVFSTLQILAIGESRVMVRT